MAEYFKWVFPYIDTGLQRSHKKRWTSMKHIAETEVKFLFLSGLYNKAT